MEQGREVPGAGKMEQRILRVVVTGAECTGKTTLARSLADKFHAVWVEEAARAWAATVRRPLTAFDVARIGAMHAKANREAMDSLGRNGVLVLDTDLISSMVYARHYHGLRPTWLTAAARQHRADLYLLCGTEVPWRPEPGQRSSPEDRDIVQTMIIEILEDFGCRTVSLGGSEESRFGVAVRAIEAIGHPRAVTASVTR